MAIVIEKVLKVTPTKVSVKDKSGHVYEYEYGAINIKVPKELIGRKVKVIVIG